MGYADLDNPIRRKATLLKWLREFGFTTTEIVRCVGITHTDLTQYRREGLISSVKTAWRPLRGRKPSPIWVWRLTKQGCRLANQNPKNEKCRLPFDEPLPVRTLAHDLITQAAVIIEYELWAAKKGGRVSGTTQVEVEGELFRPDAIIDTKHGRTYIEVEKSSSIKRRNKGLVPELSAHLFYKKLDYLTRSGDVIVWLWTRKQAEDLAYWIDVYAQEGRPYKDVGYAKIAGGRMLSCFGEAVWQGKGEVSYHWVQQDENDYGPSGIWQVLPHPNPRFRAGQEPDKIRLNLPKQRPKRVVSPGSPG